MTVQAQVEGVGTLEFPDGTDPSVVQATVKKVIASKGGGPPAAPAGPQPTTADPLSALDIAASAGSSALAGGVSGMMKGAGYLREGVETALTGHDPGTANAAADKIEDLLTWRPKTDKGKAVMGDVAKGLKAFEDWSDKQGEQATQAIVAAGDKAAEVAHSLGAPPAVVDFIERHKDQVAAAYGSATKTAIQGAPLVLGGEIAKIPGKVGELAGKAPETPVAAPPAVAPAAPPENLTLAPSAPRAAPGAPTAVPAPAAPLTAEAAVPRATPTPIEPLGPPRTPTTPRERAQAYARDRLGLAWDDLGARTREKLERVAASAKGFEGLKPEAIKRQALLESLPVPIKTTAGRLTRDTGQLLKEEGAVATAAGQPIRAVDIEANRALRGNVDYLIDKLKGVGQSRATATTREGVGQAVAGKGEDAGALTRRQQIAKAKTKAAYDLARKTEPNAVTSAEPLFEYFKDNPSVQHVGWMADWLKKAGIDPGVTPARGVRLEELDDLRKRALRIGPTSPDFHYAGQVLETVDQAFEHIPDAAKNWRAAREAHSAERGEFKNQEAIERLVGTKGGRYGTDPKTALEDVWKVGIKTAKLEQIRTLKRSLLSGETPEVRLQGKKALRELRAETGRNLLNEITKNVSTNEKGEPNITAESINNWIKGMGDGTLDGGVEKLNVIWGRRATNALMKIREAAQITKTQPTTRVSGSNTFSRILNWIEDTGLGDKVKGVLGAPVQIAEGIYRAGEHRRTSDAALQDATTAAERPGTKAQEKTAIRLQREAKEQRRRTPPMTYQGGP